MYCLLDVSDPCTVSWMCQIHVLPLGCVNNNIIIIKLYFTLVLKTINISYKAYCHQCYIHVLPLACVKYLNCLLDVSDPCTALWMCQIHVLPVGCVRSMYCLLGVSDPCTASWMCQIHVLPLGCVRYMYCLLDVSTIRSMYCTLDVSDGFWQSVM